MISPNRQEIIVVHHSHGVVPSGAALDLAGDGDRPVGEDVVLALALL